MNRNWCSPNCVPTVRHIDYFLSLWYVVLYIYIYTVHTYIPALSNWCHWKPDRCQPFSFGRSRRNNPKWFDLGKGLPCKCTKVSVILFTTLYWIAWPQNPGSIRGILPKWPSGIWREWKYYNYTWVGPIVQYAEGETLTDIHCAWRLPQQLWWWFVLARVFQLFSSFLFGFAHLLPTWFSPVGPLFFTPGSSNTFLAVSEHPWLCYYSRKVENQRAACFSLDDAPAMLVKKQGQLQVARHGNSERWRCGFFFSLWLTVGVGKLWGSFHPWARVAKTMLETLLGGATTLSNHLAVWKMVLPLRVIRLFKSRGASQRNCRCFAHMPAHQLLYPSLHWIVVEVFPPAGESGENHAKKIAGGQNNSDQPFGRVENGLPFVRKYIYTN